MVSNTFGAAGVFDFLTFGIFSIEFLKIDEKELSISGVLECGFTFSIINSSFALDFFSLPKF